MYVGGRKIKKGWECFAFWGGGHKLAHPSNYVSVSERGAINNVKTPSIRGAVGESPMITTLIREEAPSTFKHFRFNAKALLSRFQRVLSALNKVILFNIATRVSI